MTKTITKEKENDLTVKAVSSEECGQQENHMSFFNAIFYHVEASKESER